MPSTSKRLLFFTHSFPAGEGESFVASELPFLAERFSDITLVPLWADAGTVRAVPRNVRVAPALFDATHPRLAILRGGLFNRAPVVPLLAESRRALVRPTPYKLARYAYTALLVRSLLARRELRERLAPGGGFDLAYFYWSNVTAPILPFLERRLPSVARFHGSDLYEELWDGYLPFRASLAAKLDHLVFISEHGKRHLTSRHPECAARCSVHRLGVSDHGLGPAPDDSVLRLVSCSFALPVKRLHLIAQALRHLDFPVEWTHLGDGPELERVRRLCVELPQHVRVVLRGQLEHAELLAHYRAQPYDLFLNVSASEGLPVSIMEALSFGIPVLATDVGGTSEIVGGRWGQLVPREVTAQDLAAAIGQMRASAGDEQRRAARAAWAERASAERNFGAFADFLAGIAAPKR